jgi:hypothetical protein
LLSTSERDWHTGGGKRAHRPGALTGGRRGVDLMRSPVSPNAATTGGIGRGYGLGLARYPLRCGSTWGHDGSGAGYLTFVSTSPNGGRVAVLAVSTSLLSGPLVGALIPSIADLHCD